MIAQPLFKKPAASAAQPGYNRPGDWLALPDMSATEGVAGLYAVWNHDSNFVAFTVAGAFDVDWGDGTTESYASGATAEHNYDWADLSSTTLTSRGYRQAIIQITPQSGASITSLNLNVKHSTAGLVSGGSTGWLDAEINIPNSSSSSIFTTGNVTHRNLERAVVHAWAGTNYGFFFNATNLLQKVEIFAATGKTTFSNMFNACASLQTMPLFDTSSATSFASMFSGCTSLQSVPLFNTALGTTFNSMFANCRSLTHVPALNLSSGTNLGNAFQNCTSLARIEATGMKVSFSVANCSLSAAALNKIYTNLATVTGQTITVTGNYGTASDDTSIATAKGWTVTG
jgi:hypothetical protein